jgi:hypothetical protein
VKYLHLFKFFDMTYTILSRSYKSFKLILFVHPLSYSTRFGFKVRTKTGYCRAFCYATGHREHQIGKREMKSWIEYFKKETETYFKTT